MRSASPRSVGRKASASVDGYIATPDGAVDWFARLHTGPAASLRFARVGSLRAGIVEYRYRVEDSEPIDAKGSRAAS